MPVYEKIGRKYRMACAVQIMAGIMSNDRVFGPHDQDLRTSPIFDQALMAVDMLWEKVADEPDRAVIAAEKERRDNLEKAKQLLLGNTNVGSGTVRNDGDPDDSDDDGGPDDTLVDPDKDPAGGAGSGEGQGLRALPVQPL